MRHPLASALVSPVATAVAAIAILSIAMLPEPHTSNGGYKRQISDGLDNGLASLKQFERVNTFLVQPGALVVRTRNYRTTQTGTVPATGSRRTQSSWCSIRPHRRKQP